MNWKEFYGTNAEKFFYHPVDPNTTYHTRTYLQQAGKDQDDKSGSDVPSRQSLPVHQRPPQWDYIYKANRTAREQALNDAATLQSEIAQLQERQLLLEQEQAELWCKLAFRAIRRHDMHRKPVLRFTIAAANTDPASIEQAEALSAACKFFSIALQVVLKAEEDQPIALVSAKPLLVDAWYELDDAVIGKASLIHQVSDTESALGQFMALAKILSDRARTLSEAYEGSNDQLASQDLVRKDRYRGMLQRSVVDYAQILLGLDELLGVLQKDWDVRLNTSSRASTPGLQWNAVPATTRRPMATNAGSGSLPDAKDSITGVYNIEWTDQSGNNGTIRYELREDSSLLRAGKPAGRWELIKGVVQTRFDDVNRGFAIVRFRAPNTLEGTHTKGDGTKSTWRGTKAK